MGDKTSIQWTAGDDGTMGATWNPSMGCSRCSPGCGGGTPGPLRGGCYAERIAARFSGPGMRYHGLAVMREDGGAHWTGAMRLASEDVLMRPLRWRRPRRIFVNSMSDLFHEGLSDADIDRVFAVMLACEVLENGPGHTFQILTKRAERMAHYFATEPAILVKRWALAGDGAIHLKGGHVMFSEYVAGQCARRVSEVFPLRRVWLGVSVENQEWADKRVPWLLATPAAIRFASAEPLLGPIAVGGWMARPGVDWIIIGGESGHGARPFDMAWARAIIADCAAVGTACFFKQAGAHPMDGGRVLRLVDRKGGDLSELPADLAVREFPRAQAATP